MMRKFLLTALAALSMLSCGPSRDSQAYWVMLKVEEYIGADPDSLPAFQPDSVVTPAMMYFERHGSADQKLKMYLYNGLLKQKDGNNEGAMEMFVKGENLAASCDNNAVLGRLYKAKMSVNQEIYNYAQAISDAENAAKCFLESGDQANYYNTIIDQAILYHSVNDSERFNDCLKLMRANWENLTMLQKSQCYAIWINRSCQFDAQEGILDQYVAEINDPSLVMWSSIAYAHIWLDKPEAAIRDMENAIKYNRIEKDASYYYVIALAYESMGKSAKALSAYKRYIEITDEIDMQIIESDTRFIEERYMKEMDLLNAKFGRQIFLLLTIIVFLIAGSIIFIIRKRLHLRTAEKKLLEIEKQRYEQMYADAVAERDVLTKMIEDSSVKDEAKAVIRERLDILNKVIISHITDSSAANKKAFQKLEALVADREAFLETTRLTIEGNSPEFIAELKRHGLTDEEINICCLYVIGLKGKDIKTYTNQSRHYIQSGEIRHKLGLMENDTNLSLYLAKLIEDL